MSKKRIRDAAKELEKALKKHAEVVTDSAVSMKKAQRAAARLASAAQLYADAVQAKTGLGNPFFGEQLDHGVLESLREERDELAKAATGAVQVIQGDGLEEDEDVAMVVAEEPVAQWVGDSAARTDDLGGGELFDRILADAGEEPAWDAGAGQPKPEDVAPEEPADPATAESEYIESVWSSTPTSDPVDSPSWGDPAPRLPESAPQGLEDKPYAEDV